jgi:hypothetical protein
VHSMTRAAQRAHLLADGEEGADLRQQRGRHSVQQLKQERRLLEREDEGNEEDASEDGSARFDIADGRGERRSDAVCDCCNKRRVVELNAEREKQGSPVAAAS